MAFNWGLVAELATVGLAETAQLAPQFGSEDHITAANQALQAAGQAAAQIVTDPQQAQEAQAAYAAAGAIISLIGVFTKKAPAGSLKPPSPTAGS